MVTDELLSKHVAVQGNQHNNCSHQDQIFDNPSALCLALWPKHRIRLRGGTDAPNVLFMKLGRLSVSPLFPRQIYSV